MGLRETLDYEVDRQEDSTMYEIYVLVLQFGLMMKDGVLEWGIEHWNVEDVQDQ